MAVGIIAVVGASQYPIGTLARMGPGFFPLCLGVMLIVVGLISLAGSLRSADVIAERMLAAGFAPITVSRAMHLLVTICRGFAQDAVIGSREGGHPQVEDLRQALMSEREGYAALRTLIDARVDNYGEEQFAFDVDAFLAAMERLLP